MKRDERLRDLGTRFYKAATTEKQAKIDRENLRNEIFRLIDFDYTGRDHMLPVKTFEVPGQFFTDTGLSYEEFIDSRTPGWRVEHVEKNTKDNTVTFVLKKDPSYLNRVIETEDDEGNRINVSKEVIEYDPVIDWETLSLERPDLFDRLAREVTTVELNEDALAELMDEAPEELAVLQRHMKVKQPAARLVPRKAKDD